MSVEPAGRPELVFALVGPAGVRLADLRRAVAEHLKSFNYQSIEIKLSELLPACADWSAIPDASEAARITHCQEIALRFRTRLNEGAALARAAITRIRDERAKISGSPNSPAWDHVFILDQLKHPAEVKLLRDVYGPSFYLIAGHAPDKQRAETLAKKMAQAEDQPGEYRRYLDRASQIVDVDMKQDDDKDLGQNTRDTYPLADFFANLGRDNGEYAVQRFIDLLFAHPFHTPYPDEYAMYQASSVSLRSSDENRQVGAVIVNLTRNERSKKVINADVVATGMNEVPRSGGGFYWHEDSPDNRDQPLIAWRNDDRARDIKISALKELIEKMQANHLLAAPVDVAPAKDIARDLLPALKGTQFMNISEFMRPVHAEMAAIIDGARRGVAVNGLTMYVTTFPCHNCAKHIIAAGIRQVIYLEPYPKSRAELLHGEEIDLTLSSPEDPHDERVAFLAYSGIAPLQYVKVFSMSSRGNKNGVALKAWSSKKHALVPAYVPRHAFEANVIAEKEALKALTLESYKWDRERLG
jgi:cytidine deaminase